MRFRIFSIATFLVLASFAGKAAAGEAAAKGGREVPEPRIPGIEVVPPGIEPEPWTTWATGQDVSGLNRISLGLSVGAGFPLANPAGSGRDAPSYDEVSATTILVLLEGRYNLMPVLSVTFAGLICKAGDGSFDADPNDSIPTYDFSAMVLFGGLAGLRLELPLNYPASRFLRASRAEAPEGFSLSMTLLIGFAQNTGMSVWWPDPGGGGTIDSPYFEGSADLAMLSALGLEYRWTQFSLHLTLSFMDFGVPAPSNDPAWTESSKASTFRVIGAQLGLGLHF
jgi:hypothetical protein